MFWLNDTQMNQILRILYLLRDNHVFVYVIAKATPSGGNNPTVLHDVASKTNGFCIFDDDFYELCARKGSWVNFRSFQFISRNYVVSGSGRIEMPPFKTLNPGSWFEQLMLIITIENHKIDSDFISLNYTISSTDGSFIFTPDTKHYSWRLGTGIVDFPYLNGTTDYKWLIDYNYHGTQPHIIETRMYSDYYHDFLPFSDY